MDNKIEPGCTAILVGLKRDRKFNGVSVKVICYDDFWSSLDNNDHWVVFANSINEKRPVKEKNLMRIDGGNFKERTTEKESELCHE